MNISAQMVKELREKTGAGMMDCKKALEEIGGDIEKAVDWLRQKGLSKAAKKAGRATSEGLIGCQIAPDGKSGILVEIKCETDFVSRGDKFQAFAKEITDQVAGNFTADTAALLAQPFHGNSARTVQDILNDAIATIGENMLIGRSAQVRLEGEGVLGHYIHTNGKIAVLVAVSCAKDDETVRETAKNLAMQIAAASPLAIAPESLDPALLEREREVYREKAREEGKPDAIIEKIAEGAVKKYFKEVCLLEQPFIRDDKMTISDLLKNAGKTVGAPIGVTAFVRLQLGAE